MAIIRKLKGRWQDRSRKWARELVSRINYDLGVSHFIKCLDAAYRCLDLKSQHIVMKATR